MKIIFPGTSSGKASANRYYSSLLISYEQYNFLVDTGEGISRALLNCNINYNSIDGILLTHLHPDHFAGLPGLIIQMKMYKRKNSLHIFLHKCLLSVIQEFLVRSYIFPERMDFEIQYITFDDDERIKISENFFFKGRKNSHLSHLENYLELYPDLSLFSGSFLFELGDKKIIYTSDIGSEADLFLFQDVVPDILISEVNHISLLSILEIFTTLKPTRILLTHYSDEDLQNISEILASSTVFEKEKIDLARDCQIIEI